MRRIAVTSILRREARKIEKQELKENPPVRRVSDAKVFLPVPFLRQSTGYSCGAASLLSNLQYLGYNPTERELMKDLDGTQGGVDPESFIEAAKKYGLEANLVEGMSLDKLRSLIKGGSPVTLSIQAWGEKKDYSKEWDDGHYVLAIGYDDDGIYLVDPSQAGYTFVADKELESRWHDVKKDRSKKYVHLGIVVRGKKPCFQPEQVRPIQA